MPKHKALEKKSQHDIFPSSSSNSTFLQLWFANFFLIIASWLTYSNFQKSSELERWVGEKLLRTSSQCALPGNRVLSEYCADGTQGVKTRHPKDVSSSPPKLIGNHLAAASPSWVSVSLPMPAH